MMIKQFILIVFLSLFIGCAKEYSCKDCIPEGPPEVHTTQITDITDSGTRFYGELTKTGELLVADFGFCWADTPVPTIASNKISLGQTDSLQSFNSIQAGLLPDTRYYVRAFATNSIATVYGEELSFITDKSCTDTSLYFDGIYVGGSFSNDHADISSTAPMSVIDATTSYTIEVWAKHSLFSYPGGLERIYSKDNVFQFRVVDNKFTGEIGNSVVQTPYPADTFWHHLAFVRDKSTGTLKLFIDGQLQATAADNSGTVSNNGSMVCIGARNNGGGIYELWTGNLKYLRVSNIARYTGSFTPSPRYASDVNTLGLWPFNEAGGNILNDVSGNNHNGTITGAEWQVKECE